MSRSYRKTSICGNTNARSEKADKRDCNKKLRRLNRMGDFTYNIRDVSDVWLHAKDGKNYFDKVKHPKLMRK